MAWNLHRVPSKEDETDYEPIRIQPVPGKMTTIPEKSERVGAIVPQMFQQAVEQADLAISIVDVNARILYVNPAFARMTGYALEELIGANQSLLSNKSTPVSLFTRRCGP